MVKTPVVIPPVSSPSLYITKGKLMADDDSRKAIEDAIITFDDEINEITRNLRGLTVVSLAPNKTGRIVVAKCRVGGIIIKFSVRPFEATLKSPRPRTWMCLLEELSSAIADRNHGAKKSLVSRIGNEVENIWKIRFSNGSIGRPGNWTVRSPLRHAIRKEYGLLPAGVGDLAKTVNDFVEKGGLTGTSDRYQVEKALENFKRMAVHALRHGATLTQLEDAVSESIVLETMES